MADDAITQGGKQGLGSPLYKWISPKVKHSYLLVLNIAYAPNVTWNMGRTTYLSFVKISGYS